MKGENKMQAQERVIETMKFLDEESILKLYDLALTLQHKKQSINVMKIDLANIRRSQKILSSIKGSLSDDIHLEREERC